MLCVYHQSCFDGIMAATIVANAKRSENPNMRFLAMQYSSPETLPEYEPGETIYIVDFSFSGDALTHYFKDAGEVVVMDHHEGAIKKLREYFSTNPVPNNLTLITSLERSGAGLAWEYFNPGQEMPTMVKHVQDRDLWRFEYHHTKEYMERLALEPMTIDAYNAFNELPYGDIMVEGRVLLKKQLQLAKYHIEHNLLMVKFEDYLVPMINVAHYLVSETAALVYEKYPFAILHSEEGNERRYSLRSYKETGINVLEIAEKYNGSGHRNAAGFRTGLYEKIYTETYPDMLP